ncbi:MAG: PAS domain-containing sensor histidine kinase [Planctomycetales bacterium]
MSKGSTAEDLITLLDSVRIDSLFDDEREYSEILLSPANRDREQEILERTPPAVSELISRAAGLCGYERGILRPAIGPEKQLLGLLAVFRRESQDLTAHEKDAIAVFSDLAALVLENDQRRQALIVRTDELQSVFETYPDALLRIAADGTILGRYSGNQLTEILNLSDLSSRQILWHLLPQDAASRIRLAVENVEAGSSQETVHFAITHDDKLREFEARFVPQPSTREQIAVLRDVTQLRQTERALEHASEQFGYLFDHSPDAIFVESPDGVVLNANQAACELHKLSRNQLIGQNMLSLVPSADRPATSARSDSLVTGRISEFESRSLQSDGQVVPVGVRNSPITYDGSPAVLLHVRDITQQKNEEEQKSEHERQLAHVSRLTMMGQLVAGIAHEIRQPLWSLSTFADVCLESLSRPDFAERLPKIREVASKVVSEARRVNAITTRMFSFARKGTPERTVAYIHEIVHDAVELTAGRARSSRIRTTVNVEADIPAIVCDRVLIEQTLANLLNNAYAALAVHPSDAREVKIEIHVGSEDRDYITASVRDNGSGLPDGISPE